MIFVLLKREDDGYVDDGNPVGIAIWNPWRNPQQC